MTDGISRGEPCLKGPARVNSSQDSMPVRCAPSVGVARPLHVGQIELQSAAGDRCPADVNMW